MIRRSFVEHCLVTLVLGVGWRWAFWWNPPPSEFSAIIGVTFVVIVLSFILVVGLLCRAANVPSSLFKRDTTVTDAR